MAVLVFSLRDVPEDEADEVRALLARGEVAFHETGAGLLGISVPGLWVGDQAEVSRARALIDEYQRERSARQRAAFERESRSGDGRTLADLLRQRPGMVLLYVVAVLTVLYLSTVPFWSLGP